VHEDTDKQTLPETRYAKGLSGAINGAPPWSGQYQA